MGTLRLTGNVPVYDNVPLLSTAVTFELKNFNNKIE